MDKDYFEFFCYMVEFGANACLFVSIAGIIAGTYKGLKENNHAN